MNRIYLLLLNIYLSTLMFAQNTSTSLLWGYDNAGFIPNPTMEAEIIDDFGFNLVVYHYWPAMYKNENENKLGNLSIFYEERNVKWIINTERSNWGDAFVDQDGYDWYNRDDGRHYWMFPDYLLTFFSGLSHKPGVMYDEAGHMQNQKPGSNYNGGKPFFLDASKVATIEDASASFIEEARTIVSKYQSYGLDVYSEHVFPIQFQNLANAGVTPVSKILKDGCMPAYMAIALGTAIQYNRPFWLTPDLWSPDGYPGHSNDEYKSALMMAYHIGAEAIYTENLGYDGAGVGAGKGSLIKVSDDKLSYELTEYGVAAKWFKNSYVPNNPRFYKHTDLKPKTAIIRQEDACWGQADSWLGDGLFGNPNFSSNSVTSAWLEIWNLLSNGNIPKESINWHNNSVKSTPYQIFYPLDGVVVFDEKVGGEHLTGVELIFLTGVGISESTLTDVQARVRQGTLCISLPHLAPTDIYTQTGNNGSVTDGQGQWIVSESFLSDEVKQAVEPFLPQENYIRYQFGETEVQFRPVNGDNNKIIVQINESIDPGIQDVVLGSYDFEAVTAETTFNQTGAPTYFNNALGGTKNYNWPAYGGLAVNASAGAIGGAQCLQSQWAAVTNIEGFVIDPKEIYQLEFMLHNRGGSGWAGVHLFTIDRDPVGVFNETQGIRLRFMNGSGGYLVTDYWKDGAKQEDAIYGANDNAEIDYYVDGYANADYWIPVKIIFTGEGTVASPVKIDYYIDGTLVKSGEYVIDSRGDNRLGIMNHGSDADLPMYDNVKITKMKSVATAIGNMEQQDVNVTVYPNPATDFIQIKWDGEKSANLRYNIFDMTGKLIKSSAFSDNQNIDVSSCQLGVYYVQVLSDNVVLNTCKFIKK
ncbi:T9SS type A sorting domain-containing protein [Carboxylicivirga sp. RSCT41]|uniref:T9SS type A sorting domain-containing protein n=1 Tax=Carboxylicivirga agarovorans TaxID=3417570 RepID=UPI003D34AB05